MRALKQSAVWLAVALACVVLTAILTGCRTPNAASVPSVPDFTLGSTARLGVIGKARHFGLLRTGLAIGMRGHSSGVFSGTQNGLPSLAVTTIMPGRLAQLQGVS